MTNAVDLWAAWIRGWVAATNSLLEAQQQAFQRMMQMTQRAAAPTSRERESAARQVAPAAQSFATMPAEEPQRRGRKPGPSAGAKRGRGRPRQATAKTPEEAGGAAEPGRAGEGAPAEILRAAGNKPSSTRGRRSPSAGEPAAKRKRGRPRKSG